MCRFTPPLYRHQHSFCGFFFPLFLFSSAVHLQKSGASGSSQDWKDKRGKGCWSPGMSSTVSWWAAIRAWRIAFPHGTQPCLIRGISQMWILGSISISQSAKMPGFLVCIWVKVPYGQRAACIVNKLFTGARGKFLPGLFMDMMDFSKLNIIKRFCFKGSASHHPSGVFFPLNKNQADNLDWNLSDIWRSSPFHPL